MAEVDEGNAEGQVPQSWLNRPPVTNVQKKLFNQYPDALSCLPREERRKPKPDYTRFDWSSVRNDDHAMVCVYRIAEQLQTPEAMAEWFKGYGINAFGPRQRPKVGVSSNPIDLWGSWSLNGQWPIYPGWFSFSRYTTRLFAHSYSVHIMWHSDGRLGNVQITYGYE